MKVGPSKVPFTSAKSIPWTRQLRARLTSSHSYDRTFANSRRIASSSSVIANRLGRGAPMCFFTLLEVCYDGIVSTSMLYIQMYGEAVKGDAPSARRKQVQD